MNLFFRLFDFWCLQRLMCFVTSQQFQYCDSSTLANFKAWAQMISNFFTTAGWTQSSDTGQVNWSTIASPPAGSAYVYEVWQPNDGLTTFYLKVEYGNDGTSSHPTIRLTLSSSTNGAGTATGFIVGPFLTNNNSTTPNAVTEFECDMSGAAGRIGFMLWRNGSSSTQPMLFAVERSVNSSGGYTSSYVTLWTCGACQNNSNFGMGTLVFGVGTVGTGSSTFSSSLTQYVGGWNCRVYYKTASGTNSLAFNGSIPFDTSSPFPGFFDYPCTMVGVGAAGDFTEGVTFTATLYGSTRTYMPSKVSPFSFNNNNNNNSPPAGAQCVMMRYD